MKSQILLTSIVYNQLYFNMNAHMKIYAQLDDRI